MGKSTLFNRLIGQRRAIVDDRPGITRDRNYATVQWNRRTFVLIDTGGYLPEARETMERAILEQVDIAVDEADLVLLIGDARTGPTDIDEMMARRLKRSHKDAMVVVNKVDNEMQEVETTPFYKLGLGEPRGVSAINGRLSGDLLDAVIQHLAKYERPEPDNEVIKLAVVGRENAGKSSLVNTLLQQERVIVTETPGTTRDSIDSLMKFQKRDYLLIDTAGLKKRGRLKENVLFYSHLRTMRSIERADVVLYMVDVNAGLSRHDVNHLSEAAQQRKGIVLLLNKWDLIEKDEHTINRYRENYERQLGRLRYIPQLYVSVFEKKRLLKAMELATQIYFERQKRIPTSELNRFFEPILHRHLPPAVKGKEVKINYVSQVKSNPPVFAFYSNHPHLVADSYRRFLENRLREQYGFSGVPVTMSFRRK